MSDPHRQRPLNDALIVTRPKQPLRVWLGTGGSPASVLRAVELGLPMFLAWAVSGRAGAVGRVVARGGVFSRGCRRSG